MSVPAGLYHSPVSFVTVHSNFHTAAAAGDADIETVIRQFSDLCFKRINICESAGSWDIPSVEKDMHSYSLHSIRFGAVHHSKQMAYVGVYVSVRQQSEEVHSSLDAGYIFPRIRGEDRTVLYGLVHELCTL